MLILTRKAGQSIRINEDIKIMVMSITHRNQVKIGIEAPKEVKILRTELVEKKDG
ncbi:MAG: carbon storage regulator [Desulfuromusa sp.]|nr:carbon storage regulator [Desulfuromusa sp.]